jgi:transcription antitermination factor NusG
MSRNWLVATYKINEVRIAEINLSNQKFDYYLPKITIRKINSSIKEVALFPGYIFIKTGIENYSALQYTTGIKNIVKFGDSISIIPDDDIQAIRNAEESSKINPVIPNIQVGQDIFIAEGFLKGTFAKICSLPTNERINVLLTFLGSMRTVTIPIKNIAL